MATTNSARREAAEAVAKMRRTPEEVLANFARNSLGIHDYSQKTRKSDYEVGYWEVEWFKFPEVFRMARFAIETTNKSMAKKLKLVEITRVTKYNHVYRIFMKVRKGGKIRNYQALVLDNCVGVKQRTLELLHFKKGPLLSAANGKLVHSS